MKLNYKRTILVGFAFFLISAFWQAYDAIVPLILTNHFGLPQIASGAVMSLDNILAVFMLPIFGALSDKVCSKYGKRTPFIFIGTIAAVIAFVALTFIDNIQLAPVLDSNIPTLYAEAEKLRDAAYDLMKEARASGNEHLIAYAKDQIAIAESTFEAIRQKAFEITMNNIVPLIGFIFTLLVSLIAMATFRSPAVALMPDVTVKPLRSKGNAIINLMGTAGGILVLVLGMIFATSKIYMKYTVYVISVCAIMLIGLIVFIFTVKEQRWASEMIEDSKKYGLIEEETTEGGSRNLSKPELTSLLLILASVALWYIGYNSITSKYSVYASNELGFDYNLTLIIAQAAAVIAYIPVGIISSKFGRKKTILAGVVMLASAFFIGHFINPGVSQAIMYPVFILAGIGWATINVNSFPMVVELAKGGDIGKYTGYYYTASMAAQIVAPILSGLLYDIFGMRKVFFIFGTIFVIFSFITMFFVKHGDSKAEYSKDILETLGSVDD
jgi:MFS family permease